LAQNGLNDDKQRDLEMALRNAVSKEWQISQNILIHVHLSTSS